MKRFLSLVAILVAVISYGSHAFAANEATDSGVTSIPVSENRAVEAISGNELAWIKAQGAILVGNAESNMAISEMEFDGLPESSRNATGVVTVFYPVAPADERTALPAPESSITVELTGTYDGEQPDWKQEDVIKGPVQTSNSYHMTAQRGWSFQTDGDRIDCFAIADVKRATAHSIAYDPIGLDTVIKTISYPIPEEIWIVRAKPSYTVTEFIVKEEDKVVASGCAWRANGLIVQYVKKPI